MSNLAQCPVCNGFYHRDTTHNCPAKPKSLAIRIDYAFLAAEENGHSFVGVPAADIAEDMIRCAVDLENCSVEQLVPAIRAHQAKRPDTVQSNGMYLCTGPRCGTLLSHPILETNVVCPACNHPMTELPPAGPKLADICGQLGPYIRKIHDNEDAFLDYLDLSLNWGLDSVAFHSSQCLVDLRRLTSIETKMTTAISIDELQEWLDSLEAPDGHDNS